MKRKLFSLILVLSLAVAGLTGCARKTESLGLLDVAELKLRQDFDRYVIRPVSGRAVAVASGILKKISS